MKISCPRCGGHVRVLPEQHDAQGECPHCGAPISVPAQAGARRASLVAAGVLAMLVGSVLWLGLAQKFGPKSERAAYRVACDHIRAQLKAPATAKFTRQDLYVDNSTAKVLIAVDAHNAFGALIRSTWSIDLAPDPATGHWIVTAARQRR